VLKQLLCKAFRAGQIATLNLAENRIARLGCVGVAKLLQATSSLTYLNLDKCKIADTYVMAQGCAPHS